jgi:hypothetical protein
MQGTRPRFPLSGTEEVVLCVIRGVPRVIVSRKYSAVGNVSDFNPDDGGDLA